MSADTSIAIIKINKLWYAAEVQAIENFSYDPVLFIIAHNWQSFDDRLDAYEWAGKHEDDTEYGTRTLGKYTLAIQEIPRERFTEF